MLEIGEALREGRARAGLGLADVETATRIPLPILKALEEERFDRVPAGFYRRSYLREYAAFLGLDADMYVVEYEERFAPPDPELVPALAPVERPSLPLRALLSPAVLVALVAVAIAGVGIWRLATGGGSGAHTPKVQHVAGARTPPPAAPAPTLPATPPATATSLTLSAARGACWLLVRVGSSSGPIAYERTLHPGGKVRFGLRRPLWITVGAPWNLEATIGGRTVTTDLPAGTGVVVVRRAGIASTA
ncbi:MAG TPA: helix-turn-helix domain-containing protein [Gaiellaceae bacterium]|nr:helix-turn-helix domain-containing protein [Gaiellaceae bacterium]